MFATGLSVQQVDRYTKMKEIESYVGTWKLSGVLLAPPEFKGMEFKGILNVGWTLGHTALEFKARSTGDKPGGPTMEASGIVGYNEATTYEKQGFTASFAWSQDGRMLPLQGEFKGKTLVLEGAPTPESWDKVKLRIKVNDTAAGKSWDVYSYEGKDEGMFLQIKLTKVAAGGG